MDHIDPNSERRCIKIGEIKQKKRQLIMNLNYSQKLTEKGKEINFHFNMYIYFPSCVFF